MTKKFKLIRKRVALFALTAVMGISSMSCTKDAKNVSSKSLPKEPDKSHSIAIEDHSITDFEEQFTYEEQENLNNVGGGVQASEIGLSSNLETLTNSSQLTSAQTEASSRALKTYEEIAKEVINGKWGNGIKRKSKLTKAGYDYKTIQNIVNELLKGKTDNNETPVTPKTKPIETPTKHEHKWSEWFAINELKEIRHCECDEMEIRGHSYTSLKTIKTPNQDGTYTETITETCETCNYVHETIETKDMTFTPWHYNQETKLDEREAIELDYTEKREHIDNFVIYKTDDNYEYQKCIECGKTIKVAHNFDKGVIKNNKKVYTCTNEACNYTKEVSLSNSHHGGSTSNKEPHIHSYTFDHYDSNYEYWICKEDNDTITKNHNLQEIKNSDGSTTYSCTNESCTYNYIIPKEHVHTYTDLYSKDENNEVWKCSEDDSKITKEHQEFRLISDSQAPEETWTCDSCGYERKQPHSVEFTSSLDDAGELWTCTTETCGYTETKEHTLDTGTINKENHSIIYSCENKSCNYEKEEYKGEEYVFKSNDGPTGETWECTICGSKITKDHVLGPEITEEDGKYQYCTTVDCDYKKSTHIHVIAYKEKLISTKDECVEKTPFCINCDYEGTPFIISEHDYGESRYGLRCRKCGYVLENDLEEEYEEITEDLTESYTINPNKTYGYNIYYKTSSVPTEDKPLTLTLRKKDERGNY